MDELSLHILDIARNSLEASASLVEIGIDEAQKRLTVTIADDGCGMSGEILKNALTPGFTTKPHGRGLGLASLKLACELSGGELTLSSETGERHLTIVRAVFGQNRPQLGDIVSTIAALVNGAGETDILFEHKIGDLLVSLDTREIRRVLGDKIPISSPEVMRWTEKELRAQYSQFIAD